MKKIRSEFSRGIVLVLTACCVGVGSLALANKKAEIESTASGKRILQCKIGFGEFQEVSVFSMSDGTFRIATLSQKGAAQAYEMPSNQWSVGRLEVPCSHDEKKTCGELSAREHGWSYEIGTVVGDCL